MFATDTPAMVASRNSSPRNDGSAVVGWEASEVDMRAVERWTGPCAVLKRGDHTGAGRIVLTRAKRADGAGRIVAPGAKRAGRGEGEALIGRGALIARDTVAVQKPAWVAMALIVGMLRFHYGW